jgi:hypothetical protein
LESEVIRKRPKPPEQGKEAGLGIFRLGRKCL